MERHFTATCYILDDQKALLLLHPKLNKWLPPGGHLEPNETPPEGAKREALEETGLEIEFTHSQENIFLKKWNAESFERPYLCLLENIPEHKGSPPHQHIDFIYIGKPSGGILLDDSNLRWFTLEEILELQPETEIYSETLETLLHLLQGSK